MVYFIFVGVLGFYLFKNYTLISVQRRVSNHTPDFNVLTLDEVRLQNNFHLSSLKKHDLPSSHSSATTEENILTFARQRRLETKPGPVGIAT